MESMHIIYDQTTDVLPATWEQAKEVLISEAKCGYKFRGHKRGSWLIKPSIERVFPNVFGNVAMAHNYYSDAVNLMAGFGIFNKSELKESQNAFNTVFPLIFDNQMDEKTIFQTYLDNFLSFTCVRDTLLILQHHGIPTHFLDATYSIYIATYFALFADTSPLSSKPEDFPSVLIFGNGDKSTSTVDMVDDFKHNRVLAQQGTYLDFLIFNNSVNVHKVIINPDWWVDIWSDLQMMNVNGFSLFRTAEAGARDFFFRKVARANRVV
jgi:hypothetical protein